MAEVSSGVIAGIVIGVCCLALVIAAIITVTTYYCIFRRRKKRFEKGHVTGNGTAIVYSKPQPLDVISTHSNNIFEVAAPPAKAASVYSLQNGSLHGGGSVILQPAYKAPTQMSYDTTDRVFLTMPTRGRAGRKKTKAKRVLTDEMWNKSVKTLVKKRTKSAGDEVDFQPVHVQYPASVRSRPVSEYGGSVYGGGSTPSLLTVHKAVPMKTKDKKTVYVIDNSTVATQKVVMAPSGRASPPQLSPTSHITTTNTLTRPYVAAQQPRSPGHHNASFDLVDYSNQHLFDSTSMNRAAGGVGYHTTSRSLTHSPPHSPHRIEPGVAYVRSAGGSASANTLPVTTHNADLHLRWDESMRTQLEQRDRRHGSDASSMASLPRRKQKAPGEHIYKYDPHNSSLTQL